MVPFTPAAGLLEWVEDTVPLSEYLIGKDRQSGAHARYARPDDYTFAECHHVMHRPPRGDLRAAWDDVCPASLLFQPSAVSASAWSVQVEALKCLLGEL